MREDRKMEEPREEYLTVKELSLKIKFSKQSLYNLIFKGELVLNEHYLKPRPKKILFKWSAIKAWMEKGPGKPNPQNQSYQDFSLKPENLINI
jgi:predicted DNA-binding transcriptional regulator AlpA